MALATGFLCTAVTSPRRHDVVLHESKGVHDYGHKVLGQNEYVSEVVCLYRVHGFPNRGSHDLSKVVPWQAQPH